MGPSESPTGHRENQEGRPKRWARRPRMRLCLLKGCEQRFHPRHFRQRYCSEGCRREARKWSRWKAQHQYRATRAGKQKRNSQSQRYRERVRSRKPPEPEAVDEAARVITKKFFRGRLLRPARLLQRLCARATKSFATLLFSRLSACAGTSPRAGTALERSTHLVSTY